MKSKQEKHQKKLLKQSTIIFLVMNYRRIAGMEMEKNVIFATRDDFLSAIRNWGLTEKWEHAKFIFIYNSNEAMESAKFEFENNIIFICSL